MIAEGKAEKVPASVIAVLRRYGIIAAGKEVRLSGAMMREGFVLCREGVVGTESHDLTRSGEVVGDDLSEWADELAVLNRRRNILEKRLRAVALNFIRFDSLAGGGGGKGIVERVLAAVNQDQRKRFGSLPAEELIQKYYWLDLVNLVKKEWRLFERVFGDRRELEKHGDIVNDRPDAHAKEVDPADVAMYRRSLKYFEDGLASLQ